MTGLEIEINKRKINGISPLLEPISVAGISSLLKLSYNGTKHKIKHKKFYVEEALKIVDRYFKATDKYECMKYLFTEQGE